MQRVRKQGVKYIGQSAEQEIWDKYGHDEIAYRAKVCEYMHGGYTARWEKYAPRRALAVSDLFECPRCASRACTFREIQTRSADESATIFVTCTACDLRFRG
jgi:DNA-directed RNA polymerase subunit M/transcription elongation factor TFIIS